MDENELTGLALSFRSGSERSFKRLVDSLTRPLIAMAYRYTLDWESARDITQETWVRVYKKIDRYDSERPFRSWLYAVHRNACLSYLRRPPVRREVAMSQEDMAALSVESASEDPQRGLERRDFHRRLLEAMKDLSESQRQVFARVELEQMSQMEAAQALGIKPTTLRTTLHFARKRLAGILRRMGESL